MTVPPASPFDVEDVRARVSSALRVFIAERETILTDVGQDVGELHSAIVDFTGAGKRLRPLFCWWGWRAAGGDNVEAAIVAAASLELLQACALIHDDVMDGSDTRRGAPSIHRRIAALHEGEGWQGDAAAFGVAGAILLGDLCLSWSDEMLFASGLPSDALIRAKPIADIMRTELMAGQYLDVVAQARAKASATEALQVARFKSAKYTIERPLHLGVALAGGPPELMTTFTSYGLPLGEAFQLRDDVLGVFGDPEVTGKPAGDDLREGKRTFLVASAYEQASPTATSLLDELLGTDLDDSQVAALRQVIIETGALQKTENHILKRTEESLGALDPNQVEEPARSVLADLALAATNRHG